MLKKSLILLVFIGFLFANGTPHFAGMGNAGVAYGEHPSSAFINPALVALGMNKVAMFLFYDRDLDEISKLVGSTYFPVYKGLKMGVTYKSYTVNRIPIVGFDDLYGNYGPIAETISYTDYQDSALGLVFAYQFKDRFIFQNSAFGLTMKNYKGSFSNLTKVNKSGQDFDLGFYTNLNKKLSLGVSCKDIGGNKFSWNSFQKENIDAVYTVGMAFDYQEGMKLLLDLDFFENQDYPNIVHTGMDIKANQYLSCRFGFDSIHYCENGWQQEVKTLLNFGLSLMLLDNSLIIDYAYLQGDGFVQEGSHLISLACLWNNPYFKQKSDNPDLKIIAKDYVVTSNPEFSLEILNNLYQQITVNNQLFDLKNGKNILKIPLQVGENSINVRVEKINCFRLPQIPKDRYAVEQLLLASNWQKQPYADRLSIDDFSKYLLKIIDQNISTDLLKVFSAKDILITSGVYPKDIYRYRYVTRGLFADVIIRLTANDHIYNSGYSEKTAAEFLIKSGLIYPEVLSSLDDFMSEKEIIFWLGTICKSASPNLRYNFYYSLPVGNKLYVTFLNKNLVKQVVCGDREITTTVEMLNCFDLKDKIFVTDIYGNQYLLFSETLWPAVKQPVVKIETIPKTDQLTRSLAEQMKVYIKTKRIKTDDSLVIYVGLTNDDNSDKPYLITAVFANQKKVPFTKIGTRLYKATVAKAKNFSKFKVFVKDKDSGQYFYQIHELKP